VRRPQADTPNGNLDIAGDGEPAYVAELAGARQIKLGPD